MDEREQQGADEPTAATAGEQDHSDPASVTGPDADAPTDDTADADGEARPGPEQA